PLIQQFQRIIAPDHSADLIMEMGHSRFDPVKSSGKTGRSRWRCRMPASRAVAIDHAKICLQKCQDNAQNAIIYC
ncbi:MAG: hypothetical protein LM514_02715, partial [Streptococcus sp.]|nr:hypothetical protein [Streptococcus sp.]